MRKLLLLLAGVLCLGPARAAEPQTLYIAAAADLTLCLKELDAAFARTHPGVELKPTTGSSGSFLAQIKNGAPFDVFLSADMSYPKQLVKDGEADESSLTLYAAGHLVLWSTSPAVDVSQGLAVLNTAAVRKFAIANPDIAPYGRAARAALEKAGLWDVLQPKLVRGENIAQTAQFVQSGNVDAGIVALSLVAAPPAAGAGKYWRVPEDQYPVLEQGAVITARGAANPAARAYIEFLRTPEARAVLDRYGFLLPSRP
ncbi:MAG TPA: molybdate ABC transporter substrate-binding protein [Nevskia sp.]|nr:molybdate ABC transporter substrate-binding protein [Nevskia sp.]